LVSARDVFFGFIAVTGFSITAGYHRLFAHKSFEAKWPATPAGFDFSALLLENSVLIGTSEHHGTTNTTITRRILTILQKDFSTPIFGWFAL